MAFIPTLCWGQAQSSDIYVEAYYRFDGTYVPAHLRTSPNETRNDNYSTKGNVNPYTGEPGTKPRDEEFHLSDSDSYYATKYYITDPNTNDIIKTEDKTFKITINFKYKFVSILQDIGEDIVPFNDVRRMTYDGREKLYFQMADSNRSVMMLWLSDDYDWCILLSGDPKGNFFFKCKR